MVSMDRTKPSGSRMEATATETGRRCSHSPPPTQEVVAPMSDVPYDAKPCIDCGTVLPLEQFYRAPSVKDGRTACCKACHKLRCDKWRQENRERKRERNRQWRLANSEKERAREERHRAKRDEAGRAWIKKNPEKRRASEALRRAVAAGRLVRPEACEACRRECKPQGHHDDYSKPLEVRWLCGACHRLLHQYGWEELAKRHPGVAAPGTLGRDSA